jgi:hypothetical protein
LRSWKQSSCVFEGLLGFGSWRQTSRSPRSQTRLATVGQQTPKSQRATSRTHHSGARTGWCSAPHSQAGRQPFASGRWPAKTMRPAAEGTERKGGVGVQRSAVRMAGNQHGQHFRTLKRPSPARPRPRPGCVTHHLQVTRPRPRHVPITSTSRPTPNNGRQRLCVHRTSSW